MPLSNLKSLEVFVTPGDTHAARAVAWKKKKGGGISVVYVLSKWCCDHVGWLVDRPTGSPRKCAIVVTLSLLFALSISVCLCALEQLTTMSRTAFCRNCRCVANKSSLNWVCRDVVTFSGAILGEIVHTLTSAVTMDYLHEWMLQPWIYVRSNIVCLDIDIIHIIYTHSVTWRNSVIKEWLSDHHLNDADILLSWTLYFVSSET